MKAQLTEKQLLSIMTLLKNVKEFETGGFGSIKDLHLYYEISNPKVVIVRYEKEYEMGGNPTTELRISSIDGTGEIKSIEDNFKNMFEMAAFFGLCKELDITAEFSYEIIK